MDSVKMIVRVTTEKDIEVELTPSLFGGMSEDEYLAEFRKFLWPVSGMDDVAMYAARCAANGAVGVEHDGLGLITRAGIASHPKGNVLVREIRDDCACEILSFSLRADESGEKN